MKRRKIATRILTGYICIGIFFLAALLVVMFVLTNLYVDSREDNARQLRLEHMANEIDIQINTAQEVVNSLYWDDAIRALVTQGADNADLEAARRAVKARSDGATAKNMEVYVSMLEHSLDTVIGAERVSSALSFLKTEGFGSASAMDITDYFSQNVTDTYFRLMEDSSGVLGTRLAIVERKLYNNKPLYFFTFVDLNNFVYAESAEDVILIVEDGLLLACSNYRSGAPRNNMYKLLERAGGMKMLTDGPHDEGGYRYDVVQSRVMSWHYVLATPIQFFSVLRINAYLLCIAVLLAIFLIWLTLAFLLRSYAYKPLGKAVDALSDYTSAHCTAEDTYIGETVQMLAARDAALQAENEAYVHRESIEHLRYMLRGIRPDETIQRRLEQNFCVEKDGPYRVCVLEFSKYAQLRETFSEEMLLEIRRQVVEFIMQQLEECVVASPMVMDYKSFVVIVSGADIRTLRAKLMNVVAAVDGSFETELAGAVGDLCEHLSEIGTSYASALKILESHYSLGSRNAIVTSDDVVVNMGGSGLYYPIEMERELIAEVIRCHEDEVAELLTQILDENFERHALTKERLNSFAFSLASTVNRIADTLGKTTQEIFGEGNIVFLDLKMCTDKMELRGKVYGMFNTLIEFVQTQTPGTERDTSVLMLDYIHAHYNEDISLSDLSAEFSLSLSYTSTLFKEVTGENFKDYLNRYRIKRACDILMQEPGLKNTELAKRVGFNTVATLLRLFNKYEGTTPGQYARKE
ncbi:MAG: helix-turn-helix domain-containing protein [Clostridia bacterium]|nr:helix-turn-helix domain-containing protein [Clostridia bacterium]